MNEQTDIAFLEVDQPFVWYDGDKSSLNVDDVELQYDFQLGDDDLEVSLLIESLEEQYAQMIAINPAEQALSVQSAKEWICDQRTRVPGLFRYLNNLTA